MYRNLLVTVLALAFSANAALADPWKNESGKGRHDSKEYWKYQEKVRKEAEKDRKAWEKRWREEAKRGHYRDDYYRDDYYRGYREGDRRAYYDDGRGSYGEHYYEDRYGGYEQSWQGYEGYPQYVPRPRSDRPLNIYTPFGYYEETPRRPYGDGYPRLEGQGQIGPFRFEVWR